MSAQWAPGCEQFSFNCRCATNSESSKIRAGHRAFDTKVLVDSKIDAFLLHLDKEMEKLIEVKYLTGRLHESLETLQSTARLWDLLVENWHALLSLKAAEKDTLQYNAYHDVLSDCLCKLNASGWITVHLFCVCCVSDSEAVQNLERQFA